MNAEQIIELIRSAEKKTPVKVYLWEKEPTSFPGAKEFPAGPHAKIVFGDWKVVAPALEAQKEAILDMVVENQARNSAVPLLDTKNINARIEPGAIIRDQVELGDGAVIMMGAILNIGAVVGQGTMIDMGAVLGGRATPVVIEDDVLIGANAVILEGVRVGRGAVVAAGAVVIADVPPETVVAGVPARVIKAKDEKAAGKTALVEALREL